MRAHQFDRAEGSAASSQTVEGGVVAFFGKRRDTRNASAPKVLPSEELWEVLVLLVFACLIGGLAWVTHHRL